jgi:hypothetical protein
VAQCGHRIDDQYRLCLELILVYGRTHYERHEVNGEVRVHIHREAGTAPTGWVTA